MSKDARTCTIRGMLYEKAVKVKVVIDFGSGIEPPIERILTLSEQSTVFDALTATAPVLTSRKFGMDHFVEAIAGIKNDFANDRGWHFEVNGYRSNVPAERYLVKDGDLIKWLYLSAP